MVFPPTTGDLGQEWPECVEGDEKRRLGEGLGEAGISAWRLEMNAIFYQSFKRKNEDVGTIDISPTSF